MHRRKSFRNLSTFIVILGAFFFLFIFTRVFLPRDTAPEISGRLSPTTTQIEQREIDSLSKRVDDLSNLLHFSLAFFAFIITLGSGVSLFGFIRAESRAREAHLLSMAGELGTQSRAHEMHSSFIDSSKNTLDLVNATLQLAKDASYRAAQAVQERAKSTLIDLDKQAKELIQSLPHEDARLLSRDPNIRSKVISLANKIDGLEVNRLLLPTDISLTPHCLFIRDVNFRINQQILEAMECWQEVALSDDDLVFSSVILGTLLEGSKIT